MGEVRKKVPHTKRQGASFTPDKNAKVLKKHKDSLFRFLFRDKESQLQLYNALNGSSYTDADSLEITTLENVIYIGYKNDISFLLDSVLTLAEHQGSWNPNMPLRGLPYFSRLYMEYVQRKKLNMYGSSLVQLPFPQYVVFYNGTPDRPEREVLRLSDSYRKPGSLHGVFSEPAVECTALVLNINYGNNRDLMSNCRPLLDYSLFIHYIRDNLASGYLPEEAVDLAVDRCLSEDILTDILRVHRKEVTAMFLEEFDEEFYKKAIRKESYNEGRTEGETLMLTLVQKLLADKRLGDLERAASDPAFRESILREYNLLK